MNYGHYDDEELIVIQSLKDDLERMLQDRANSIYDDDRKEDIDSVAHVLKYYMAFKDYQEFVEMVGYSKEHSTVEKAEGFFTVDEVKDNPDGSADITVTIRDDSLKQKLLEEGLSFTLLKSAFNVTSDEVAEYVKEGVRREEVGLVTERTRMKYSA